MLCHTLKIIAFPLAVLAVFGLLYAIWLALDLPPEQTIVAIGKSYLDRYGLWVILVCAYSRALVVIGWYFPGTLVIIVAMIAAVTEPVRYVETAALGAAGLYCGQVTNFFAGKHWHFSRRPVVRLLGDADFLLGPAALSLILIWIAARLIYRWKFEKRAAAS